MLCLALFAVAGGMGYWVGHDRGLSEISAKTDHSKTSVGSKGEILGSANLQAENKDKFNEFKNIKGRPDVADLAEWAKDLTPEECAAYLAQLKGMAPGFPRDAIMEAVVNAWAAHDPKGFLASTDSVSSPRLREVGVNVALKALAAQSPQEALQWLKDNPGNGSTASEQARYAAAMAGFAETDPQGALSAVLALSGNTASDQRLKNQAMQAITASLADQGRFNDALTIFGQIPDGNLRNQAYNNLAARWAQASPADASSWAASLTDPAMRGNFGGQIASVWAGSDPQSAAAWAADMDRQTAVSSNETTPDPAGTNYLLTDAIRTWANYDLNGTGDFLNSLPASPDKDGAVASFALSVGLEDPASAMQWVNTIGDPQMQQRLAMVTAIQWQQTDPDGYNQFISTTDVLSDEQKQVLGSIPPQVGAALTSALGATGRGGTGTGGVSARVQNYIINGGGIADNLLNPAAATPAAPGTSGAASAITNLLGRRGRAAAGTVAAPATASGG
jgi:hypothetical protein